MASGYTSEVNIGGSSSRKYRGYVNATVSNVNNTTSRVSWSAEAQMYNAYLYGLAVTCTVDGTQRGSDEGYLSSNPGKSYKTVASCSGTTNFSRGTSAKSVTVTVRAYGKTVSGYGSAGGSASKSVTVSIPALPSYTISYNANGGSGAPSSQTKYYGRALTLSSTKPTRPGYTFAGWATSSTGSVAYAAGASYTANAAATLYAVWTLDVTYEITYNAMGGYDTPANQTKLHNVNIKLTTQRPLWDGYKFLGWATSSGSSEVVYNPGDTYTENANLNLYAVWKKLVQAYVQIEDGKALSAVHVKVENGTPSNIFYWVEDEQTGA